MPTARLPLSDLTPAATPAAAPSSTGPGHTPPGLAATVRSEAIRLHRPTFTTVGAALLALFTLLGVSMAFFAGGGGPFGQGIDVEAAGGVVAGLEAAVGIVGIVVLSLWATATAADHSSGLIRLQVQAEPRRWRLLVGKALALAGFTVVAMLGVTALGVALAYAFAAIAGTSTAAWGATLVTTVAASAVNVTLAALGYGLLGLTLATVLRSSTLAVSAGVGYLFLVEGMLANLFGLDTGFLPGGALSALASGGTVLTGYTTALVTALAWVGSAVGLATWLLTRRDITE